MFSESRIQSRTPCPLSHSPLVSVLVTVYNREAYLRECIESILQSTFGDFEVIVVDDKSTDRSMDIAKVFANLDSRVKVFQNERNLGDYPNRNRAAQLASGYYLKYVDSDDTITPECLEKMVLAMQLHSDAAYALSYPRPVGTQRPLYLRPEEAYREHLINRQGFFCAGPLRGMIRTDRFREVGGFRPQARNMGDTILWMELSRRWPMLVLEDGLTVWREHENQEFNLVREVGWNNVMTHCQLSTVILRDFLVRECPLNEIEVSIVRRRTHIDNIRRFFWHAKNLRLRMAATEMAWAIRSLCGRHSNCVPREV